MTLNELLKLVPESDRDLPVCLYTGWEGDERLPATSVKVVEGEYLDAQWGPQTGRHILISPR